MSKPISKRMPVEIDTEIAKQQEIEDRSIYRLHAATNRLERGKKTTASLQASHPEEYGPDWKFYEQVEAEKEIAAQVLVRDAARAAIEPLHAEFVRRGYWSRFYLVLNGNGHCHSSTHCSTCFPTTRFGWVTSLSGSTEEEAVKEYGEKMCTVCFPSAPASKFWGEGRVAREEREAKDARKAERAAKRAVKDAALVLDERGRVLYKTERGAELDIVSKFETAVSFEAHAHERKDEPGEFDRLTGHATGYRAEVADAVEALAVKRGVATAELRHELLAKAQAQYLKKYGKTREYKAFPELFPYLVKY